MMYSNAHAIRPASDVMRSLSLPDHIVPSVLTLVDEACTRILGYYNNADDILVDRKADRSPITAADRAAHDILCAGLLALCPDIPVLSEESPDDFVAERHRWDCCWLVDPLDGTREFIGRTDEFTVNVALVWRSRPVLGVISVPVTAEHYVGIPGVGAWRCDAAGCQSLAVRDVKPGRPLAVLASVRHSDEQVARVLSAIEQMGHETQRINAGSALKFCRLVDGQADIYPRTSPCYEWDVAAGDAIVTGAGGFVWGVDGTPMRYNCRDTLLVKRFVAGADASVDWAGRLY